MAPQLSLPQTLTLFIERVDRSVARRAVVDKTVRAHFSVSFSAEADESKFESDTGDEEDLRSLLLEMRPFFSPREPVHAPRVFNLLEQNLERDGELWEANRQHREHWKLTMRGHVGITIDGKAYTAEQCLDLITNGEMFHLDQAKAAEFRALRPVVQALVRQQVASLLIDALRVLWVTRNIAAELLEASRPSLENGLKSTHGETH